MDHLVHRVRVMALPRLEASYRPRPPAGFVREALGFADDGEAERFMEERGAGARKNGGAGR